MTSYGDIRPGWYGVSCLPAGLVVLTRYRHPVVSSQRLARLEEIIRDVCAGVETGMAEFNG